MNGLSIVLPARNEEATIEAVVGEVFTVAIKMGMDFEIIVVNDGSTDRTGAICRDLGLRIPCFRFVENYPHRHYGGALKSGFALAQKEWIAFLPTDKQFDFSEIDRFLAKLDTADIVSGYRIKRQDPVIRLFNAWCWNMTVRVLFGFLCCDIDCGFKVFRREILNHVKLISDGALIDTELLAGAKARSYRIAEVPLTHLPRLAGKSTGANLSVIVRALRDLWQYRLRLSRELREEKKSRIYSS